MEYIVSQKEMQLYDANTIDFFKVPALTLMERAAISVVNYIKTCNGKKVLVICGGGNNGGDGFAVARLLLLDGYSVEVLYTGKNKMSEGCEVQCQIYMQYAKAKEIEEPIIKKWQDKNYDIIVDAMFGVGLNRELSEDYCDLLKCLAKISSYKIALDIPTGIDTNTGQIHGMAFQADVTITFGFVKRGLVLFPGKSYAGKVICADIGITKESFLDKEPVAFSYQKKDINRLPVRPMNGHKGCFGKIGLIAGCENIGGAAILATLAGYHSGCGYVKVFTHVSNKSALLKSVPEAVIDCYDDKMDYHTKIQILNSLMEFCDVVHIGSGIGKSHWSTEMVTHVLKTCEKPLVVDADAINIIAADEEVKKLLLKRTKKDGLRVIFTPHMLELSRLSGSSIPVIQRDICSFTKNIANELGCIMIAKDAATVVSDGSKIYINRSGNDGMGTAGSGDVLAGIVTALAAQCSDPFEAATLSVYIHGVCGDLAKKKTNARYLTASDLIMQLSDVLKI